MKPYMAYSKGVGAEEGAVLVFANTVKEARKLAWGIGWLKENCDDEWIDLTAKELDSDPWIMSQAISEKPHVIESPETCEDCLLWGLHLDENGLCEDCREE